MEYARKTQRAPELVEGVIKWETWGFLDLNGKPQVSSVAALYNTGRGLWRSVVFAGMFPSPTAWLIVIYQQPTPAPLAAWIIRPAKVINRYMPHGERGR